MATPSPQYDVRDALYRYAPGVLLTAAIDAALVARYRANGFTPLTQSQILAITGPPPAYPSGLKRFADSNPASDGWSIDRPSADRP